MPPSEDPATSVPPAPRTSRWPGVLAVLALLVSIAALGLAVWTAFAPRPSEQPPVPTDAEQATAKSTICAAVDLVRKGVALNTQPQDDDVPAAMAIAAMIGGGQYLLDRLDPATPPQLAVDVRDFAGTLMDVGAASTAGALNTDPDQAARLARADALSQKLTADCA